MDIMFYGCLLGSLLIFLLRKPIQGYFRYADRAEWPLLSLLALSALGAAYIMWQLKAIFKTLDNPFVESNIQCFRKIAVACFLIGTLYIVKCMVWFTIATAVIAIFFTVATLFCLTLKDVFKQAVAYKIENDWTV